MIALDNASSVSVNSASSQQSHADANLHSRPCELTTASLASIEQGIWTVISYFAESDPKGALAVAHLFQCSVNSIHDFDWERLEEVFGSKGEFLKLYSKTVVAEKAEETAIALADLFKNARRIKNESQIKSSHTDEIYQIGMNVGAAVALGEVHRINAREAQEISAIVAAPIALNSATLLPDFVSC